MAYEKFLGREPKPLINRAVVKRQTLKSAFLLALEDRQRELGNGKRIEPDRVGGGSGPAPASGVGPTAPADDDNFFLKRSRVR